MADKDEEQYSDEYQFSDLDEINSDTLGEDESIIASEEKQPTEGKKDIKRNALIAIVLIVLAMLGYKFLGSFFAAKGSKTEIASVPPLSTGTPQPAKIQEQPAVVPVQTVPPPVVSQPTIDNSQVTQKLSALEMSQQNMRSEVNTVNTQLSGINTNVNELTEKIANLNQIISSLASKLEQQSERIAVLTERTKPKLRPRRIIARGPSAPLYYIQAVIPGRAWLIAANGSTLTVREGTHLAGYGVVRLIDPNQGRVVTSSGKVIRFSQQDS